MNERKIPRGIRNNNPLNIRKGNKWQGERRNQVDSLFEEFESIEFGLRAGFKLIRNYMSGRSSFGVQLNTIEKIVHRWAPPSENATQKYIDYVAGAVGIHPKQVLKFEEKDTLCRMVQAMCMVENGCTVDIDTIRSAYDLV